LLAVVLQGQCDASLLLKKNKDLTIAPEINATTNQGIRGLDFIDYLKTRVVAACVGKKDLVSYADIIALPSQMCHTVCGKTVNSVACRLLHTGILCKIPTGRLDGKVSLATKGETLPGSRQRIVDIVNRFAQAGFSAEEAVILSGNPLPLSNGAILSIWGYQSNGGYSECWCSLHSICF
jgi:peroxidase